MRIPYVIDNRAHKLADVLRHLLATQPVQAMDIATAYFSVRGYQQVADGLNQLQAFRLLLGAEVSEGVDIGLHPVEDRVRGTLRRDLDQEPFAPETLGLVEDLIRFLEREDVQVRLYYGEDPATATRRRFLHAKAYLMYGGRGNQLALDAHLNPLFAIVGSSNFTGPGLTSNLELNTVHKAILAEDEVDDPEARSEVVYHAVARGNEHVSLDNRRLIKSEPGARAILDLRAWYDEQWALSADFKPQLIDLLDESKFGRVEYTPYEVYMKALYEYFKDDLGGDIVRETRTAVELAEFQEDAVRKARQILARYDGVMIADSVGLGKTWIGKRLLEDYAYHLRQKALVICPASLRSMWEHELREATIPARIISQEMLGRELELHEIRDVDVVLIDESHNFRNRATQRYEMLERLLSENGRRGRDGARKKIILLTATPINNTVFDLYNQINLFTGGDRAYFAAAGIGDLQRYFLAARRASRDEDTVGLFNLLEEVVVRRSRAFIKKAYKDATISGKSIKWPQRQLKTVQYDLEATYANLYEEIVGRIESLRLPHYNLESYRRLGPLTDDAQLEHELQLGREQALVGIFRSRFLKRFESSIEAFRISVRRALEFIKTFDDYLSDGKLLNSASFQAAMRYLESEDDQDMEIPSSQAEALDASQEAAVVLDELRTLDTSQYNIRQIRAHIREDIDALTDVWYRIKDIKPESDAKLNRLKGLLSGELKGKKLLIFTYYKDTARYLGKHLASDEDVAVAFRQSVGNPHIRRIDGGNAPGDRDRIVQAFAPEANGRAEIAGTDREIDVLIATDVLSEGQNLQDAAIMLNYDLHWNPTRMVQRAGRIDRLGSKYDTLWVYNMFPDEGLERLLHLVQSLMSKIETINQAGLLDASVLGETVTPRDFNTLRRIREEDNAVIEEQEAFVELVSSEALLRQLQEQLANNREWLESLPDGIQSGLQRPKKKGIFFYFTAPARRDGQDQGRQHFWRYYDLESQQVMDNRFLIANLIQCQPDTPRFTGEGEVDIFEIQERVIASILQSSEEKAAVEAAPKQLDPIQQNVITLLRGYLNNPDMNRQELRDLMKLLRQPMPGVYVKELRQGYDAFLADQDIQALIDVVRAIKANSGNGEGVSTEEPRSIQMLSQDDLHLICFDYVWS